MASSKSLGEYAGKVRTALDPTFCDLRDRAEKAAVQLGFKAGPALLGEVNAEINWWENHGYGLPYKSFRGTPNNKNDWRVRLLLEIGECLAHGGRLLYDLGIDEGVTLLDSFAEDFKRNVHKCARRPAIMPSGRAAA
jgi:hypothetical protein